MGLFFQDLTTKKQEQIIECLKVNPHLLDTDPSEITDENIDEIIDDFINRHNNSDWIKEITDKV